MNHFVHSGSVAALHGEKHLNFICFCSFSNCLVLVSIASTSFLIGSGKELGGGGCSRSPIRGLSTKCWRCRLVCWRVANSLNASVLLISVEFDLYEAD